ncbi:hypothetical protein [Lactiplantibacillus pentosus]|uniref:hypothetical protein n=1 Tax=Lactiplantibacillus pentosus TaxID=1589 RepID=UPI0013C4F834|nr:hypothetical protein [Lactiplantibacillus pentosus]
MSNEMFMTVLGVRETRESNGHINGWINHNGGINPEMKALVAAAWCFLIRIILVLACAVTVSFIKFQNGALTMKAQRSASCPCQSLI